MDVLVLRAVLVLVVLAALAAPVRAEVRVAGIEASRDDSLLSCTVLTTGLPDGPSLETLASGLPSSLTLSIVLVDATGRERGGSRSEIRIEPDPWERSFRVRSAGFDRRASDLEALRALLRRIGPIPVTRLSALDLRRPPRIRVRLAVHALAPAEVERAHALFSGDMSGNGADRREVSAGLGTLLRYFLGRAPSDAWRSQALSAPLDLGALPRLP